MCRHFRIACWLLAFSLVGCASPPPANTVKTGPLILISIDGFRPDYLDRGLTPNLAALAASGVRAQSMRPSFPAITFPNHYTLVTGLYPDHHGIVNNTMEDPAIPGQKFTMASQDPRWWAMATPIWITAQRRGLRAATMFWPGSEIPHDGMLPEQFVPYDKTITPDARVDKVLGWLALPQAERPGFVTLYFDQVDGAGHAGGPDSDGVDAALGLVDRAIGRLVAGLRQRQLFEQTNLVIVADHGMENTARDRTVYLDDLVDIETIHVEATGVPVGLHPEPGHEKAVERALLGRHGHLECWRKDQIPARFHYGTNRRVPAIICLPDLGWSVWTHDFVASLKGKFVLGMHGYDNAEPDMGALFIAEGPAFRQNEVHAAFDNVDVYPLLAHLMAIEPEANDGQFRDVSDMLKPDY